MNSYQKHKEYEEAREWLEHKEKMKQEMEQQRLKSIKFNNKLNFILFCAYIAGLIWAVLYVYVF